VEGTIVLLDTNRLQINNNPFIATTDGWWVSWGYKIQQEGGEVEYVLAGGRVWNITCLSARLEVLDSAVGLDELGFEVGNALGELLVLGG